MGGLAASSRISARGYGGLSGGAALLILILIYATAFLDRQILNLLVGPIKETLKVSDTKISFAQGFAFVIAFTLCSMPVGIAVDRFSRRNIIVAGALLWSLFAGLAGLSQSYGELLLARIGVGASEAALAPAVYSLLADSVPKTRLGGTLAIFSTGAILGGGVSLAGGAWVIDRVAACPDCIFFGRGLHPWQIAIILMALPGLLFGAFAVFIAEPDRRADPQAESESGLRETLRMIGARRGFYVSHFLGFSLLNILCAGWLAWVPSFLIRTHGWSLTHAGLTLGVVSLIGGLIGMLGSGHLADHLYRRGMLDAHLRLYMWAAIVLGIAGVVATLATTTWLLIAAMLMIATISAFIAVAAAALQITSPPRMRGKVSALFLATYNILGFGLGPAIVAFASDTIIGDESKLWLALLMHFVVFAPLCAVVFALGLKPMRSIVAERAASDP